MSDLQQVIRERENMTGDVKPRKVPKWVERASKSLKIWWKLMKRRYPKQYCLLKLLRFHIGI